MASKAFGMALQQLALLLALVLFTRLNPQTDAARDLKKFIGKAEHAEVENVTESGGKLGEKKDSTPPADIPLATPFPYPQLPSFPFPFAPPLPQLPYPLYPPFLPLPFPYAPPFEMPNFPPLPNYPVPTFPFPPSPFLPPSP